ncbi:hypothetical protein DID88_009557 [Monilinia fructigena]|uniref:Uncharacterized protein n=1 Tax=Monilinia fructigena TaxID=38457 RepID=A0A395IPM0_9HELO|nr:hypothetical protein DID88_009557 [Monilinia fructigena]
MKLKRVMKKLREVEEKLKEVEGKSKEVKGKSKGSQREVKEKSKRSQTEVEEDNDDKAEEVKSKKERMIDSLNWHMHSSFSYFQSWTSSEGMAQWDDWVPQDRVMKFTEDNKELAAQLHQEMKKMVQKPKSATTTVGKKLGGNRNGSEFGSGRGSEERHASVAAQGGRGGPRRNRDYDLEQESSNMAPTTKSAIKLRATPLAKKVGNSVMAVPKITKKPQMTNVQKKATAQAKAKEALSKALEIAPVPALEKNSKNPQVKAKSKTKVVKTPPVPPVAVYEEARENDAQQILIIARPSLRQYYGEYEPGQILPIAGRLFDDNQLPPARLKRRRPFPQSYDDAAIEEILKPAPKRIKLTLETMRNPPSEKVSKKLQKKAAELVMEKKVYYDREKRRIFEVRERLTKPQSRFCQAFH